MEATNALKERCNIPRPSRLKLPQVQTKRKAEDVLQEPPAKKSNAPITGPPRGSHPNPAIMRNNPVVSKKSAKTTQTRTKFVPKSAAPRQPTTSRQPATTHSQPAVAPKKKITSGCGGKKIPAWDLKGRLQSVEAAMGEYQAKAEEKMADFTQKLMRTMQEKKKDEQSFLRQKEDMELDLARQVASKTSQLEQYRILMEEKLDDLNKNYLLNEQEKERVFLRDKTLLEDENFSLKQRKQVLEGDLAASTAEITQIKCSLATLTTTQCSLKAENDILQRELMESQALICEMKGIVAAQKEMAQKMETKIREDEMDRRKLHNIVQELKGNIRVFCRARPLLGDELLGNNGEIPHMNFADGTTLELERLTDVGINESSLSTTRSGNGQRYCFKFDQVFAPQASQDTIFHEISQLVQSALDGYNVCVFAYGQTGSGKTYTMEGPNNATAETDGMIPRAVHQVFDSAQALCNKGWKYTFEVTFLEIYNETIRDLLGNDEDVKHEIKMVQAKSSEVMVTNLKTQVVTDPKEVSKLLKKAGENRAVAATKCNERSSRSHSVFRMKICGTNEHTQDHCSGVLNLIDLAGSERLKDSGSQGQRLKETQNINASLANLGNVIMALAKKDPHIPYRNSKLTHLLQNSLGGSSKCLMFVNINPKEECLNETLNSLRFATKVNNCHIGTATKQAK